MITKITLNSYEIELFIAEVLGIDVEDVTLHYDPSHEFDDRYIGVVINNVSESKIKEIIGEN